MRNVVVVFVAAFVVATVGYVLIGREDEAAPSVTVDMRWLDTTSRLVVADERGAVVAVENRYRGVDRDGTTVWQQQPSDAVGLEIVCAVSCPAVVISGDLEDFKADAPPALYGGAILPKGWEEPTSGSNVVLAVGKTSAMRLVSDADGRAYLEMMADGKKTTQSFPSVIAGWNQRTPDGRAGILISLGVSNADGSSSVMLAWHTAQGWKVQDPSATSACIAAAGDRWVAGAQLTVKGHVVALAPELVGRPCQFTSHGVVFGGLGAQEATDLVMLDDKGQQVWTHSLPPYALVSASQVDDRVAVADITPGRQRVQVLGPDGSVILSRDGFTDARYVGSGELALVDMEGGVGWLPR